MNPDTKHEDRSVVGKFFDEYSGAISFIGIAAMTFALLQIMYFQFLIDTDAFYGYLEFCAGLSTELLTLIGEDVVLTGRTMTSAAGPSVTVVEGCDALRIYSVLVAAIIAYESTLKQKVSGILIGVSLMFLFNVIRISMLLWVDVHYTDLFELFHHTILPFGLWIIAMAYFYYWGLTLLNQSAPTDQKNVSGE